MSLKKGDFLSVRRKESEEEVVENRKETRVDREKRNFKPNLKLPIVSSKIFLKLSFEFHFNPNYNGNHDNWYNDVAQ